MSKSDESAKAKEDSSKGKPPITLTSGATMAFNYHLHLETLERCNEILTALYESTNIRHKGEVYQRAYIEYWELVGKRDEVLVLKRVMRETSWNIYPEPEVVHNRLSVIYRRLVEENEDAEPISFVERILIGDRRDRHVTDAYYVADSDDFVEVAYEAL